MIHIVLIRNKVDWNQRLWSLVYAWRKYAMNCVYNLVQLNQAEWIIT